jgi:hypothetical protein
MLSAFPAPLNFRPAAKRNYTSHPPGCQGPPGTFRKTGTSSSAPSPLILQQTRTNTKLHVQTYTQTFQITQRTIPPNSSSKGPVHHQPPNAHLSQSARSHPNIDLHLRHRGRHCRCIISYRHQRPFSSPKELRLRIRRPGHQLPHSPSRQQF